MTLRTPIRPTWIEISKNSLRNNVKLLCDTLSASCKLMAVVKANGYGHDAVTIAPILLDAGATFLAVATLGEAIEMRQSGIAAPILVLGYTPDWLVESAILHSITLTLFDEDTASNYNRIAFAKDRKLTVHVKVNTGMNRLGILPEKALQLFRHLQTLSNLAVEGIFTHFATSDLADKTFAYEQFNRFQAVITQLAQESLRPDIAHAANSAALLTMPKTHLDMVRSGIAMYGLHPDPEETRLPEGFIPALSWKAIVAQVACLEAGESVSYGREFIAHRPTKIAIIPVGYADGFPRHPHTYGSVLIHGQHAPIIGRVCMDQTIVDVTEIDAAQPVSQNDEVVLIGRQRNAEISVDHIAHSLQTNNYDVVSRILSRVPRIVVN